MSLAFIVSKRLSTDGTNYTLNCELPTNSELYYKLNLYSYDDNTENSTAQDIEFVDILPFVGDTGVLLTSVDRLSEFSINLASFDIIGEVLSSSGKITNTSDFTVEYSSSSDPIRFGFSSGEFIGVDKWDNPNELDLVKSIKITTNETFKLSAGDTFSVILKVKTPKDATVGTSAYNSFAGNFKVYDPSTETIKEMLPTEGTKVGVTILNNAREQSFIDLMTAIALQQTALSSILEGEALKIEKANEISSQEEIILINQSVNQTIQGVTTMEELFIEFLQLTCNNGCK